MVTVAVEMARVVEFQFTRPQGARPCATTSPFSSFACFNSRARKGRDCMADVQ